MKIGALILLAALLVLALYKPRELDEGEFMDVLNQGKKEPWE